MSPAYGDGSVYRRGYDGRFVATYSLPGQTRRYFYARTRPEVRKKLKVFRQKVERDELRESEEQTLEQYLDWWLDDQTHQLAPETWRKYESMVRLYILPALGAVQLRDLSPMQVREFVTNKLDDGKSAKYVKAMYNVLHVVLGMAHKMEIVRRNVVALVDAPRLEYTERPYLTVEQAVRLLESLEGDRSYAFIRTLLTLGLRPDEGLGLQWKSVDLDLGRLRVEATLQRHNG